MKNDNKTMFTAQKMSYLKHLDGIRALALLSVLSFHFNIPILKGGYLGVDCFLVLSGFLMTRKLFPSIRDGTFTMASFYKSRFWRLYPSSLCVIMICLYWSFLFYPSHIAEEVAQSAVVSMLFSSNIFFYTRAGYFSQKSLFRPLLHTWSLSLEEQFYMIWPALLIVFKKYFSKNQIAMISLIAISSFMMSLLYSKHYSRFKFYMLPMRVFEFGAGSMIYFVFKENDHSGKECWSFLGLLMILGSFLSKYSSSKLLFGEQTSQIMSVLGTCILIYTPKSKISTSLLSNHIMSRIGKISYSVYLVHWPVSTAYYWITMDEFKPLGIFILFIVSFVLGYALHVCVENPYRKFEKRAQIPYKFSFYCILIVCSTLGYNGIISSGWKYRFLHRKSQIEEGKLQAELCRPFGFSSHQTSLSCFLSTDSSTLGSFFDTKISPQVVSSLYNTSKDRRELHKAVVIGNSFARMLVPAFHAIAMSGKFSNPRQFSTFLFLYEAGCKFSTSGYGEKNDENMLSCKSFNIHAWEVLKSMPRGTFIIWSENWSTKVPLKFQLEIVYEKLKELGLRLVVFLNPPGGHENNLCIDWKTSPMRLFRIFSKRINCLRDWPAKQDMAEGWKIVQEFKREHSDVHILDIFSSVCNTSTFQCASELEREGKAHPLYTPDAYHMTSNSSVSFASIIYNQLLAIFSEVS